MQRMKELGVDRVRITASWSSLTRAPEEEAKPEGFNAADPGAYEQARWAGLDTAIRAIRAAGLKALVDIGFWAPHWATDDPPGPRARSNIDPQAYADFATAVALRYSGAFTPPPEPGAATPPEPTEDASLISELIQPLVPFPLPDPIPPLLGSGPSGQSVRAAQAAAPAGPLPSVDRFIIWNEPNHQGLLLPQWRADDTTPASPAVYRAMVRVGLRGGQGRAQARRRCSSATRRAPAAARQGPGAAAGVPARARLRRREAAPARDRRLRGLHDAAGRRLGAPSVLPERAPRARQQSQERARRPAPRRHARCSPRRSTRS